MALDRAALARALEPEPSGEHLLYEGTYQRVKDLMTETTADATYGIVEQRVDWSDVVKVCSGALAERTKDFYLGCCLLRGLIARDGARGLVDGLWFLSELNGKFWDDYHPRPRERRGVVSITGRANQLKALVTEFPQYLEGLPMDASGTMTYYDWKNAGKKLPGDKENPWTEQDKQDLVQSASWDFYADACDDFAAAQAELKRFTELVYDKFGDEALSLGPVKDGIDEIAAISARNLQAKGPSPYLQEAQTMLAQTRCTLVEEPWLEAKLRAKTGSELVANSLYAAVADVANGYQAEAPWTEILESAWNDRVAYQRRTEDPAAPEPAPGSDPTSAASAVPSAPGPGFASAGPPPAPSRMAPPVPTSGDPLGVVLGACQSLRRAQPHDPLGYTLPRIVQWAALDRADPNTPLRAPTTQLRQQCQGCIDSGNYQQLLDLAEGALITGPATAWLDLQRFATMALGNLIDYACDARYEIIRVLGDLLRRQPWIVNAQMDDNSPTADSTTRDWISEEVLAEGGAAEEGADEGADAEWGGMEPAPVASDDPIEAARSEAITMLHEQGFDAAVRLLDGEVRAARAGRDRARLQLILGEVCMEAGNPGLARPVLESVREEFRRRSLYDWEGQEFLGRALEALHGSYRLLMAEQGSEDVAARMAKVADELAQVDLTRALRLQAL